LHPLSPLTRRPILQGASLLLLSLSLSVGAACSSAEPQSGQVSSQRSVAADPGDYAQLMSECLSARGWNARAADGGGLEVEVPVEQDDAYLRDLEACRTEFGYDRPLAPLDASGAEEILVAMEQAAECLRESGYSVPEQPSRQTSLDGLMTDRDPRWEIYADIARNQGGEAVSRAQSQCPY